MPQITREKEFVELVNVEGGYAYKLELERSPWARDPSKELHWYHITVITPDDKLVNVSPSTNDPKSALEEAHRSALRKIEYLMTKAEGKRHSPYVPDELQGAGNLAMPKDLSPDGQRAYAAVMKVVKRFTDDLTDDSVTGGCRTFYSGREWTERGEKYGKNAELVVVYDGGLLSMMFSGDDPRTEDRLAKELEKIGMWSEPGYSWMRSVYKQ